MRGWRFSLDSMWQEVSRLPIDYNANTVCALDGLAYASFTKEIYELLEKRGIIDRALGLELKGRSARERIIERIGAAYLWGIEPLEGRTLISFFNSAAVADFEVLTRIFWTVRGNKLEPEQRERILAFWEHTVAWAEKQPQLPDRLLSTLSLLSTYIVTVNTRERRLLETVAPHVHVGHETYEFIAELLRLAQQDPAAISKVLQSMLVSRVPDYDYQGRLLELLQFLASHGQQDAVILMTNRLRHIDGVQALFKSLTEH